MNDFLRNNERFTADLNLVVQLAMGAALLVGALLARAKRYSAHGICQSSVLTLNLVSIFSVMLPSFRDEIWPALPRHLTDAYYGVASAHGLLGVLAESFGIYLLLVAVNVLPNRLCIRRLRFWMRAELCIWLTAIATGLLTYYVWYMQAP